MSDLFSVQRYKQKPRRATIFEKNDKIMCVFEKCLFLQKKEKNA